VAATSVRHVASAQALITPELRERLQPRFYVHIKHQTSNINLNLNSSISIETTSVPLVPVSP
jgi:hypothetical protein